MTTDYRRNTISLLTCILLILASSLAVAETIEYEGLIEPYEVVEIGAPAEGIVAVVNVDRSSLVEKGQVLVELESSVERTTLEKARAQATFDGDINLQQAQLAFNKRVHQRVSQLAVIPIHEKDLAATEFALTDHRLEKARENQILAKLELHKAQALLARRSIKSPITGVVVERFVSPGEYVNTQPLLRVAQIEPLRVEVIVPATMYGRIQPGMSATVIPDLERFGKFDATVTIVDNFIDSASNTFGIRLELPNAGQQVPSGLKCLVRFDIDGDEEALVNATAKLDSSSENGPEHRLNTNKL